MNKIDAAIAAAHPALYEVQVGYTESRNKDRWVGSWTGVADSEVDANKKALAEVWGEHLSAEGLKPIYASRIKPQFVVAENWGHGFVGRGESITRWAYDRVAEKLVHAEIQTDGQWGALTASAMNELKDSIHDNDADGTPDDFGLLEVDALPTWAQQAPAGSLVEQLVRTRKPR